MPHVTSIGLGGGSLVRSHPSSSSGPARVTVGPDSVGYRITEEALVFGGQVLTATDIAVRAGDAEIGDSKAVDGVDRNLVSDAKTRIKTMLELTLDSMKTSSQLVPVYLVGGGAMLAPSDLSGVSKVHRFPHYECANAVGAAIAQVAGSVDSVEEMGSRTIADVRKEVEARAIERAVEAGAKRETVSIVESEAIPVAYTAGRCRFFVKAAGEWTGIASSTPSSPTETKSNGTSNGNPHGVNGANGHERLRSLPNKTDVQYTPADILAYRPKIVESSWFLSELDLEFICTGTYIMGCGGGGDPHHNFLAIREMVRAGKTVRVIDLGHVPRDGLIGWGGGMGSPEVASERMLGEEYNESVVELLKFMGVSYSSTGSQAKGQIEKLHGLAALEIGGSNGMINMVTGASHMLDLPIIDGDFMGRAVSRSKQPRQS